MKNKLIITLLMSIFILAASCSKGGTSTPDVSGMYKSDSETYTLNADGTGKMDFGAGEEFNQSITWTFDGEYVTFNSEKMGEVKFKYVGGNLFFQASGATFVKVN